MVEFNFTCVYRISLFEFSVPLFLFGLYAYKIRLFDFFVLVNWGTEGIYQEKRKGLEIGVSKTLPNLLAHPKLNIAGCLLHFPVNNECDYGS